MGYVEHWVSKNFFKNKKYDLLSVDDKKRFDIIVQKSLMIYDPIEFKQRKRKG